MSTRRNVGIAHCIHHDEHFEWCYDLVGRRLEIVHSKPKSEHAIRAANLWLLPLSDLPISCQQTYAAYERADAERKKTCGPYYAAWARYERADSGRSQKARDAVMKAKDALIQADDRLSSAIDKCRKAMVEALPEILVAHDRLVRERGYVCTWNGKAIF